ncbi:MAG: DUF465 domain-containing protein [Pseudomonadota bacterium]
MPALSETEAARIRARIAGLETEHRDLDAVINHLEATGFGNQLALQRLKKRKLGLKDEIELLSMRLVPDIPA